MAALALDLEADNTNANRVARGKRRRLAHSSAAALSRGEERTFLEVNSVQRGTAEQYRSHLLDLGAWLAAGGVDRLPLDELDPHLCE